MQRLLASAVLTSLVLGILSLATGCIGSLFKATPTRSEVFAVKPPSGPWETVDAGPADRVYRHPEDRAALSVQSVCGQYETQSLEELTETMLNGLGKKTMVRTTPVRIGSRPALRSEIEGVLDGRPYRMSHTVFRGSGCIYDLELVADPKSFPRHEGTYQAFLDGFREGNVP